MPMLAALRWKATPWAHWAAGHRGKILELHKFSYMSTSIPIAYHNGTYKIRFKNSMRGWCLKRPRVKCRGMAHVVNTDALVFGCTNGEGQGRTRAGLGGMQTPKGPVIHMAFA